MKHLCNLALCLSTFVAVSTLGTGCQPRERSIEAEVRKVAATLRTVDTTPDPASQVTIQTQKEAEQVAGLVFSDDEELCLAALDVLSYSTFGLTLIDAKLFFDHVRDKPKFEFARVAFIQAKARDGDAEAAYLGMLEDIPTINATLNSFDHWNKKALIEALVRLPERNFKIVEEHASTKAGRESLMKTIADAKRGRKVERGAG